VVLVHHFADSDDLEKSFGKLFDALHWPRGDGQGGVLDENPHGLSLIPDDEDTRRLKAAIENATKLHVEIPGRA